MTERADYDNAILLSQARLRVQDPDLLGGKVEKLMIRTNMGTMERPWGIEGGFAVVYKFYTQQGRTLALRCFRVSMQPDTQQRYERIGAYFSTHLPQITAHFRYHEQGILVKETVQGKPQANIYPLIEMEWIEGETLLERVDTLCRTQDRAGLKELVRQWQDVCVQLRRTGVSHGDLSGGNVMVRTNGRLVLVDYDGVYLPEFAQLGLHQVVLGQADYQHAQMQERPFNEFTDDFSALVIYTALLALSREPSLWTTYTQRTTQGKLKNTNLLFRQQDFVDPAHSSLFNDLARLPESDLQAALTSLRHACYTAVENVRFPPALLDPGYEQKRALARLEKALQSQDEQQILAAWQPELENYPPAQAYVPRVQQAQRVLQALQTFQHALQTRHIQEIVASYDASLLDTSTAVSAEERACVRLAQEFVSACSNNDDQAIITAWENTQNFSFHTFFTAFTPLERQRIQLAQQRQRALVRFRVALSKKRPEAIVASYDAAILDACKNLLPDEHQRLALARAFVTALQTEDEQVLLETIEAMQPFLDRGQIQLSHQEQQRIDLARQRQLARTRLQVALTQRLPQKIAAAYDLQLDEDKLVTERQRMLVRLAKKFVLAFHLDSDREIAQAAAEIQRLAAGSFLFTEQEQQRIQQAEQRQSLLKRFQQALRSKQAREIAACYDPRLDQNKSVTAGEREIARLAQEFIRAYEEDKDQALIRARDAILNFSHHTAFAFTPGEQKRIELAEQRVRALTKFRIALRSKRIQNILAAYESLLETSQDMTMQERRILQLAQNFVQAERRQDAQELLGIWQRLQDPEYRTLIVLTDRERQRIAQAQAQIARSGGNKHA